MTNSFDCWHRSRGCAAGDTPQPPAFSSSTATLDDLLSLTSSEQVEVQHPDSGEIVSDLPTEVLTADKQVSQRQNKPGDPFMPSASALPDFILQHTVLQSSDDAAASFSQSGESLSLLDADMPQASHLLSCNQPTRDLSAAMPHAATAAAAAAVRQAHPRSVQTSSDVHEATSVGLGTLSVDSDAQDIFLTTTDLCRLSNPKQGLAISQDTGTGDIEIQDMDHSAAGSNDQNQLEPRETRMPKSPELDGSLSESLIILLPASEAQTTPDNSLVPAAASRSHPAPALSTVASDMQDQQATSAASDANFVSTNTSSAKHQQQQQQQQPASKDASDAQVEMLKHDAVLKPHEAAMAKAEQAERRLLTGDMAAAL